MTDAIEHSEAETENLGRVWFAAVTAALFVISSGAVLLTVLTMRVAAKHIAAKPPNYITGYSGKLAQVPTLGAQEILQTGFFWVMFLTAVVGIIAACVWALVQKRARVAHWAVLPVACWSLAAIPAVLAFSSGADVLQLLV